MPQSRKRKKNNANKQAETKGLQLLKQQQLQSKGKIRNNKFIEDAVLDLIEFVDYISEGEDKVKFFISSRGYQRIEIVRGKEVVHWLEDALIPANPDDYSEIAVAVMTRLRYEVFGEISDDPRLTIKEID